MSAGHLTIGKQTEDQALSYLEQQGLSLIKRNFRCSLGEIDLIMRDRTFFVFVEVRFRGKDSHGGSLESITRSKQNKIIRTAMVYLRQRRLMDKVPCRFDVVAIGVNSQPVWIKGAFTLD